MNAKRGHTRFLPALVALAALLAVLAQPGAARATETLVGGGATAEITPPTPEAIRASSATESTARPVKVTSDIEELAESTATYDAAGRALTTTGLQYEAAKRTGNLELVEQAKDALARARGANAAAEARLVAAQQAVDARTQQLAEAAKEGVHPGGESAADLVVDAGKQVVGKAAGAVAGAAAAVWDNSVGALANAGAAAIHWRETAAALGAKTEEWLHTTPPQALEHAHDDRIRSLEEQAVHERESAIRGAEEPLAQSFQSSFEATRQLVDDVARVVAPASLKLAHEVLSSARDVRAAEELARGYYLSTPGFDEAAFASHGQGIDLSKSVQVVNVPKGTTLYQWVDPNRGVGRYFAYEQVKPEQLGIYAGARRLERFVVTEDVSALRSTAAAANDTWNIPGQSFRAPGGATQLFVQRTEAIHLASP